MALSKDWTLIKLYREAAQDLHGAAGIPKHTQKDLVNRAVSTVAGQFYDLMSQSYLTEAYANLSGTHKYETGSGGTYTVATRTLAFNEPSAHFDSTDLEKVAMFRIGTAIYLGTIESITTTHNVVFKSTVYPAADNVFNEALVCGTTLSNSLIPLTGLRIMRTGANIRIELTTTATATIKAGSTREVDTFDGSGRNSRTIVWALCGDNINFAMGDDLTSAGTLIVRYPRVPTLVSAETDAIDLPDGTAIEIAIIYLRSLLQRRLKLPVDDNEQKLTRLIGDLYKTFSGEVNAELVKEKVMALK